MCTPPLLASLSRSHRQHASLLILLRQHAISLSELTQRTTGIAHGHNAGWNVARDHTPRPNHGSPPYGHTGADGDIATQPAVVANGYRLGTLILGIAFLGQQRMDGGVHCAVGTNKHVLTDGDASAVHEVGVAVDEAAPSHADVPTIVAGKVGHDRGCLGIETQKLVQNATMLHAIVGIGMIEGEVEATSKLTARGELPTVTRVVPLPCV